MISFDDFVLGDNAPIYTQLILYIKRGIVSGVIQDKDPVPSRRFMSSLLGVNPNTIQKAYQLLEKEGLLQSQSGTKSIMTISNEAVDSLRKQLIETDMKSIVAAMQSMGIEKETAKLLFDQLWEEEK